MNKILTVLFFTILSLDFRGQVEGGGLFQSSIVVISCALGAALVLVNFQAFAQLPQNTRLIAFMLLAVVAISGLVFLKNSLVFDSYIRVLLPVVLCAFSFCAVAAFVRNYGDFIFVVKVLIGSAILSAIWRFYYSSQVVGISLNDARYQILSVGTSFLLAYSIYRVFLGGSKLWFPFWIVIFLASLSVIFLSITRSYLLAVLVVLLASTWVFFVAGYGVWRSSLRIRFISSIAAMSLIAFFAVVPLMLVFRPDVLYTWTWRIFDTKGANAAVDPTAGIRIAQVIGQVEEFRGNEIDILFGRGFGAFFTMNREFVLRYATAGNVREEDIVRMGMPLWQNPDTTYVPALFSGGLFFLFLISSMFYLALKPLLYINRITDRWVLDTYVPLAFCVLFFFVSGWFGNLLLDRYGSALFGGLIALILFMVNITPALRGQRTFVAGLNPGQAVIPNPAHRQRNKGALSPRAL